MGQRIHVTGQHRRRRGNVRRQAPGDLRAEEALVAQVLLVAGVLEVVLRRRLLAHEEGQREEEDGKEAARGHQKREDTPATNE